MIGSRACGRAASATQKPTSTLPAVTYGAATFRSGRLSADPAAAARLRLLRPFLILENADRGRSLGELEQIVGLEPLDAADELPDIVLVLGECFGEVGVSRGMRG